MTGVQTCALPIFPTTSDVTSLGVARLFRDGVWKLHGLPEEVISDRGPQFVSNFMRGLSETLGIKVAASMAYHPQTDGQTERVNQEVEQFLHLFVNQRQDDWYDWISMPSLPITSVGEVRSRTDWNPVWTRPNPTVPVQVWDFPENIGPLGLRSGHSHIARDRLRPGLDRDRINLYKQYANILFLIH